MHSGTNNLYVFRLSTQLIFFNYLQKQDCENIYLFVNGNNKQDFKFIDYFCGRYQEITNGRQNNSEEGASKEYV